MKRIFLSPPHVGRRERELMCQAYDSNWIAPLGPFVNQFEENLSHYFDGMHACVLSSGTAALHLGLLLFGVQPGDRVYCSDLTFAASANVIKYCGAEPVFIDADHATWNMDPRLLEEALERDAKTGKLPKAVIVVDLYGISADYEKIESICAKYEVPILEDSAEALGSKNGKTLCGAFGSASILSFNGNKIITTSGGGAFLSKNKEWVDRARFLATQARENFPYYHHKNIGYNYRLSNISAAIGVGQLQKIDQRVQARRRNRDYYKTAIEGIEGVSFMPEPIGFQSNAWLTVIQLDPSHIKKSPEDIRQAMEESNIECRRVWKPMHLQPVYADYECMGGKVGEMLFDNGLCLPSGSNLTESELAFVSEKLIQALGVTS